MNYTDGGLVTGDLYYYQNPNYQINADGPFYYHRPWSIKSTGSYLFPFDAALSWYVSYSAGRRWGAEMTYADSVLTEGSVTFLAEPRGTRALDPTFQADLRAQKSFNFSRFRLSLIFDAYNIFNNSTVAGVEESLQSSNFGEATSVQQPRTLQLGLKFEF
jgi:hypothetical protein